MQSILRSSIQDLTIIYAQLKPEQREFKIWRGIYEKAGELSDVKSGLLQCLDLTRQRITGVDVSYIDKL